jgi:GrpB-like predicted nucleotidyltransferase (UPF0157 family)
VKASPIGPYPHPSWPAALRPWNPLAPAVAARVIAMIQQQLPDTAIEHVGSSAVPGCAGKGYIDLVMHYRDAAHLAAINAALFALGLQRQRNRDPFPEDRPMRTGSIVHDGETFLIHVHVIQIDAREATSMQRFRDRLRADPDLVRDYVATKRAILDSGVRDGGEYAVSKGRFITELGYQGAEDV